MNVRDADRWLMGPRFHPIAFVPRFFKQSSVSVLRKKNKEKKTIWELLMSVTNWQEKKLEKWAFQFLTRFKFILFGDICDCIKHFVVLCINNRVARRMQIKSRFYLSVVQGVVTYLNTSFDVQRAQMLQKSIFAFAFDWWSQQLDVPSTIEQQEQRSLPKVWCSNRNWGRLVGIHGCGQANIGWYSFVSHSANGTTTKFRCYTVIVSCTVWLDRVHRCHRRRFDLWIVIGICRPIERQI